MSITERVAYLKGLAEGLDIDANSKEGKLFGAIIDVLEEMSSEILDLNEQCEELNELVDVIDEDLGQVESDFYDVYDDEEDDDDDDDGELYEVVCPSCDNVVYLDEEMLLDGEIDCPECGQKLEFDMDDCDCDCGCGCGCDHEHEKSKE